MRAWKFVLEDMPSLAMSTLCQPEVRPMAPPPCNANVYKYVYILAEPKQSGHIGCSLTQIARFPQIGIGNLAFGYFARLGSIWHKKSNGTLDGLVIPRLEARLAGIPYWYRIGLARLGPDCFCSAIIKQMC